MTARIQIDLPRLAGRFLSPFSLLSQSAVRDELFVIIQRSAGQTALDDLTPERHQVGFAEGGQFSREELGEHFRATIIGGRAHFRLEINLEEPWPDRAAFDFNFTRRAA